MKSFIQERKSGNISLMQEQSISTATDHVLQQTCCNSIKTKTKQKNNKTHTHCFPYLHLEKGNDPYEDMSSSPLNTDGTQANMLLTMVCKTKWHGTIP